MADEISINFYQIDQCGYYKRGADSPEFGEISSVLEDLYQWINEDQPTVRATQTFTINDESSILPVYCYDIKKNQNNDFLLITWNETETAEGAFASVRANHQVGSAQVTTTAVPNNSIPGHPSYFWFIPEENIFATIRFGGRLTGNPGMNRFIQGFLEKFSTWVQIEENEERSLEVEVLGYAEDDESEIFDNLKARFKSSLLRKNGEIDYIRENCERIRKIVRKDEYVSTVEIKRSLFRAMFDHLGLTTESEGTENKTRFKYEFNYSPSEEELEEVIESWQERHEEAWDDVGFEFEGESGTRWLGSSIIKDTFEANLRWNESHSVANATSLLRILSDKKDELLRLIDEE